MSSKEIQWPWAHSHVMYLKKQFIRTGKIRCFPLRFLLETQTEVVDHRANPGLPGSALSAGLNIPRLLVCCQKLVPSLRTDRRTSQGSLRAQLRAGETCTDTTFLWTPSTWLTTAPQTAGRPQKRQKAGDRQTNTGTRRGDVHRGRKSHRKNASAEAARCRGVGKVSTTPPVSSPQIRVSRRGGNS